MEITNEQNQQADLYDLVRKNLEYIFTGLDDKIPEGLEKLTSLIMQILSANTDRELNEANLLELFKKLLKIRKYEVEDELIEQIVKSLLTPIPKEVFSVGVYLHPFRLIKSVNQPKWNMIMQDVNSLNWDYVRLHEISSGIDIGLPAPYHMLVCSDGLLVVPPIGDLKNHQKIIEFFNSRLAALLISVIYCEAVTLDHLEQVVIMDWKYVRVLSNSTIYPNRFHNLARLKMLLPIEAIALLDPPILEFKELKEALTNGMYILNKVPELSPEFILKGTTGFAKRDWGVALINLWIAVKQCVSHIWKEKIITQVKNDKARKGQLEDNRTWSMAPRLEMLLKKNIISIECYNALSIARKARNLLSHTGIHPTSQDAHAVYKGFLILLETICETVVPLSKLDLKNYLVKDPFGERMNSKIEPEYWMQFRKSPNEK